MGQIRTQWEKIFDFRPKATIAGESPSFRRRNAGDGRPYFELGQNQGENRKIFTLGRNQGAGRRRTAGDGRPYFELGRRSPANRRRRSPSFCPRAK